MANIKVKFKEAYQDFGAYALLKNVTDKGVLIVDGTEVLNSIVDLPTTDTVDGQEKAVIVQNGQVITTSISNIGGESGGDFIPLTGTTVGNPVTNRIGFLGDPSKTFASSTNELIIGAGDDLNIDENAVKKAYISFSTSNGLNNTTLLAQDAPNMLNVSISATTDVNEVDAYKSVITIVAPGNSAGLKGNLNFTPNITDLDYTQKIYVDTHIAFTPIPTSSTDPGIKGQMAVDATYLYICVDTDTWTRVALAW